jgi:DNA mismatch endonuclease (patch repair protein)
MAKWPGNAKLERTTFGHLTRAELMARVRSRGNKTTEIQFAAVLKKEGITGWRRHQSIPGKPDFVWRAAKLALFLDGCFWHGHACRNTKPKTNAKAWKEKIKRNQRRDRQVARHLRARGWTVVRIWECQITKRRDRYLALLRNRLAQRHQSR